MILRLPNPLSAVAWLAFLLPAASLGSRADLLFAAAVLPLAIVVLATQPAPWEARGASVQAVKVFALLEAAWLVSYVYSAAFNGIRIGPLDLAELPRYALAGALTLYAIRHYDARVHASVALAAAAAPYASLALPSVDPYGYLSVLALCWQLFFARGRARWAHAAAAALAVALHGGPAAWAAALLAAAAALAVRHPRGRGRPAALFFALLYLAAAACALRAAPTRAAALVRGSPLLGWGPARYEAVPAGLSQYAVWLVTGGALGEALVLAGVSLAAWRLLRACAADPRRLAGAAAFLGGAALTAAGAPVLESYRLFFATVFLTAAMHEAGR